ncbi:site-specific integrase [Bradyrhizobium sp. ARR65]|uniref:site-specific integrase n=1 Tax=Bradyrhizobium sp. ARR65 TaxID=1040989 RepID=UPI00046381C9|nr:site-specific integrase [Bradyrhizobium sp. ARR65]
MNIVKDRHGTYYVQQRVPERLQEAVARVLDADEPRRVFLKKSLGTKNLKDAKAAAPHVLAEFGRIIGQAEALLKEQPVVTVLTDVQIKRMAESYYATLLAEDEQERREGTGSEPVFQKVAKQLDAAGVEYETAFAVGALPETGMSEREFVKQVELVKLLLPAASAALARGDITVIREQLDELLYAFQCNLDRKSPSYRKLGMAVLTAHVRGLKDIERRNAGEPIETPQLTYTPSGIPAAHEGGTLRDALDGWKKERARPEDTVHEYTRAVEMFIQLHGNLPVANIKRSHARTFREALQLVPRTRKGALLKAGLPELSQWGREHPDTPKVSAGTVNKQLGAVQAIAGWGQRNGLVPDEVPWSDPFKDMRLEEERSTRGPFDARGLQAIFDAPLFTQQEIPEGGKGPAAVWLPLLALFAGGRQSEFAGLRASDVREDPDTGTPLLWIVPDKKAGRRVKTETSERVVPVHSQLIALGFLEYAASRRREDEKAWLFPAIAPDQGRGAIKAWSKWWGYYLREHIGIKDRDMVFHSFRHGFTDRARAAKVEAEVRKALMGHADPSVSGEYGAKNMLMRWGARVLKEAVEKISYPGLDLSRVQAPVSIARIRGTKTT